MFALIERVRWGTGETRVAKTPGAIFVAPSRLHAHVEAMTGRGSVLAIPSVARRLRETGRVYIAGDSKHCGVLVERV